MVSGLLIEITYSGSENKLIQRKYGILFASKKSPGIPKLTINFDLHMLIPNQFRYSIREKIQQDNSFIKNY